MIKRLYNIPFFLFLLPLFFVLHGVSEHLFFVPLKDGFILLLEYFATAVLLAFVFWFFFRDTFKASLASALSLGFFFFFGAMHDVIKTFSFLSFFSKYSVLLPILVLFYLFILLKIKKGVSLKFSNYLNWLFISLLIVDCGIIIKKIASHKADIVNVEPCKNCEKPDVYFIVLDGYAGQRQLVKDFSFSNSSFLSQLQHLGFRVMDSSFSNYGDTPFSMSSVLNMKYLSLTNFDYSEENLNYCYEQIANNKVVKVFKQLGYQFINNSIFDIQGQSAPINKTFLISGTQLITSQTLWGRFKRDVYNNVIGKYFPNSSLNKNIIFSDLNNNENIYQRTLKAANESSEKPRFIYSHLLMPHFPYYYDSSGKLNSFASLGPNNLYNDSLYLGYLKYCNRRISDLMELILETSLKPPIILLLSDHGYRKPENYSSQYFNLAAVYLPNRNFSFYRNNLSNINQFTVLFNVVFRQRLPMQSDKIIR